MEAGRAGRWGTLYARNPGSSVANALEALWTAFAGFAPRLLGARLVVVFTFLAARLLQRLGAGFLQRIGLDGLFERTGAASSLQQVGFGRSPSFVFGYVLFWGCFWLGSPRP